MLNKKGLTASQLKIIAIGAMVLDHVVKLINVEGMSLSQLLGILGMNAIGRITMPIMCFFVAEGFYQTRDIKKYMLRMAVFAAISQIPFYLMSHGLHAEGLLGFIKGNCYHLNAVYTLFIGLAALCAAKSERLNLIFKIIICTGCILLTKYSDWRYFGVMWVLAFGLLRGEFWKQALAFAVLSIIRVARMEGLLTQMIQLCTVFALPLLYFYNGEKGRQLKYGFYIFYPVHMLIIWIVGGLM